MQDWQLGAPGAGAEFHRPVGFLHLNPLGWGGDPG